VESLRGQLLIASPTLQDPNFRRTVVLICEHSDEGALGLVLNRATALAADEAAPELAAVLGDGARLHAGGPVQPESIVLLAEFGDDGEQPGEALLVTGGLGLVLQGAELDALEDTAERARAFLGYAGWAPEQLESELEREDWILLDAEPDDAFTDDPEALWSQVLARKGGEYALLATMPPDPSLN
jgi:putative transcriptional regulator